MSGLNNSFKIVVANIRYFQFPFFLLAFIFLGGMIVLFGVVELGELAVNGVFGRVAPLLGLILISPIAIYELNKEISDVIFTKLISYKKTLFFRLIVVLIFALVLYMGYAWILAVNETVLNVQYVVNSFINMLFLGSMGLFFITIFKNITTGYMIPILYYLMNFFIPKQLGMFYLFDMTIDRWVLLLCTGLLVGASIYWVERQK